MLCELLMHSAEMRADVPAVADARVSLTYARLLRLARVMRDVILAGTHGPRVGLMLPASSVFSAALFGGWWAGKQVVPLNFLLSESELAEVIRLAGLDLILGIRHFAELTARLPVKTVFLDDLPMRREVLKTYLRRIPAVPPTAPDDTAVILFTSGTAGMPKGVELSCGNLLANCQDCIATARITADHRFLNCLPPFHVFGLTANVIIPVALGASVYCLPRFSAADVVRTITAHDISVLMAIPSMYNALVRLKSAPDDLVRNMYLLISGGEPLHRPLAEAFEARFGRPLLQGYGLTETAPVCTLELPEAHCPGSVGRPIRNVQVRIAAADGSALPPGEDGEICVRGPNVMKGYYCNPEETSRVINADGWFRTGDGGRCDAQGFLHITGRIKEMIIVGGENVYPREIEAVLEQHPAVAEAAVIGIADATRGEVPLAFVICKEGQTAGEGELREFARERLAGYKVPRSVRLAAEFPRSPTGKVLKRKLHEML